MVQLPDHNSELAKGDTLGAYGIADICIPGHELVKGENDQEESGVHFPAQHDL
jgi:hypothetical protein